VNLEIILRDFWALFCALTVRWAFDRLTVRLTA